MNWIRITCLAIALGSFASPSSAAEVNLVKASAEQLKAVCQKVGGSFSTVWKRLWLRHRLRRGWGAPF